MALSGFKSLGDKGWVGFFSNIFPDRDIKPDAPRGERFTYDALKEALEWMNAGNLPDLEFWHLDNLKMGKATNTYLVGPFIVAEGVWNDDEIGRKAQRYFDKSDTDWRMSHGFGYLAQDRVAGEYTRFRPHELTVLSEKWAANPLTLFKEADMAGFKDDLIVAVADLLGIKPDEAKAKVEAGLAQAGKSLPDGEIAGKKDAETENGSTTEATVVEPATADPKVDDDALALALVDALAELGEERSLREELTKQVKGLAEAIDKLQGGQKSLQDDHEKRLKALEVADEERVKMLPRAVKAALSKRIADNDAVDEKAAREDINQREAGLKGEASYDKDPVGWMMQKAGVKGAQ